MTTKVAKPRTFYKKSEVQRLKEYLKDGDHTQRELSEIFDCNVGTINTAVRKIRNGQI